MLKKKGRVRTDLLWSPPVCGLHDTDEGCTGQQAVARVGVHTRRLIKMMHSRLPTRS